MTHHVNEELVLQCWFVGCRESAVFEAIGTYDDAFGVASTMAIGLCDRHASVLRDDVVILTTDDGVM
jgi:hypothetical protein